MRTREVMFSFWMKIIPGSTQQRREDKQYECLEKSTAVRVSMCIDLEIYMCMYVLGGGKVHYQRCHINRGLNVQYVCRVRTCDP